ncbi:MAG: hypothetical protein EON57_01900 [Alphaproteobacteria bacterium]|nr:MAG: hypothetical protein EON57_01900 [Alphaproteobacteria bacterium]
MTRVHARSSVQSARPDDSAALQRRLLQDLERQWLETWGQAGHGQTQSRPSSEPDQAARPPAAEPVLEASSRPPSASRLEAPDPQAVSRPSADGAQRHSRMNPTGLQGEEEALRPDAARAELEQATEPNASPPPPPPQATAEPAAALKRGGAPVDAGSAQRPRADALSAPVNAALGPAAHGLAAASPYTAVPSPGMLDATLRQLGSPLPEPSLAPLSAPSRDISAHAPLSLVSQAALKADGPGEEQAAVPTRRTLSSREAQEPSARHLMLRELNDQEVLASMRDAQLTSSESALAAQGLARALMQAGYARVQVVVNGRPHQQEAVESDGAHDAQAATPAAPATSTSSSTDPVRHGH